MGENRILKKIGGKLREESRALVEATLPEQLRVLMERLACVEVPPHRFSNGSTP